MQNFIGRVRRPFSKGSAFFIAIGLLVAITAVFFAFSKQELPQSHDERIDNVLLVLSDEYRVRFVILFDDKGFVGRRVVLLYNGSGSLPPVHDASVCGRGWAIVRDGDVREKRTLELHLPNCY